MPLAHWYTGHVISIKDLSPNVRSFQIEIPEVKSFPFKAGQFITLDLPVGEKRLQRWRSYSISSPPVDDNIIELCIVHFDQGLGSSYFFDQVVIGSELKFKAPEGGFILPEADHDHDLVLICTGTGIAPFRSMIWDIYHTKKTYKNIHLIFGSRHREDVLYLDEWEFMAEHLVGFRLDIALSRESNPTYLDPTEKIIMQPGYVHPIYQKTYSSPRDDVQFYICGWSKMIDEAVENLFGEMGFARNQIHYELYG